jgi:16S rRNA (adenine1518-N6/adenine1519-N6)-dimethyltransferase
MTAKPQTIADVQQLLARQGLEPNRRFGQNFLIDGNLMRMVVDAAELDPTQDVVLEVGPGTGSLTCLLAERAARVIAVEADTNLVPILDDVFAGAPRNVELIVADALAGKHQIAADVMVAVRRALETVGAGRFKLVANLPYVIATPLVINLLIGSPTPALLVFTVQRELADRLAAAHDTADYGPLSILAQALGAVECLHDLSPNVFWPKPQVHSTLVRIRPDPARYQAVGDVLLLQRLAGGLFAHRRKTCHKSLELAFDEPALRGRWGDLLASCGIDPAVRGETLALGQVLTLLAAVRRTLADASDRRC